MAPPAQDPPRAPGAEEGEEEDYMNMTFGDVAPSTGAGAPAAETSLQRRQRLKREAEIRGRPKSKAELEAEAAARREEALSRSLLEGARAKKSKGFAMMAKMGFKAGGALGAAPPAPEDHRLAEPIRPQMKEDRGGIGLDAERKRKVNEAAEREGKKVKVDEAEFRGRVRREREEARCERLAHAAMKVCERMDEERREREQPQGEGAGADGDADERASEEEGGEKARKRTVAARPLKSIPVEWRGLVRRREEAERDRRMRYDLEQSSAATRLPTYADDLDDDDDRRAVARTDAVAYAAVEDLEDEDEELEEFDALEVEERLRRVVVYLRKEFRYCFWCKYQYPDENMEGCPGSTEEDHD
ncbi:hypothetical protein DL766_005276 [Monosporascus sp. MC13-8B]|uniref:G-patch domain-containing protein n=1 Tax=Monosporascus cannonballus TaxID=155416 RepID=A0ABY0HAR1_9PEZI|nr:hypothetical protein DL762_004441 [Monosporascus cannonballus]RYO87900.1 hypothetical protein DL763_006206 [Monosporascus cannonballus]RYP29646.1 hypothetical protein DL766_005276 [Monosporascus sp. MC13-8B]